MKRFLILRSLLAVVATMLVSLTPAAARAPEHKLDQALRGAGRGGVHRVIVRTTSAGRDTVRQALRAHGDRNVAEPPGIDALTADVHRDDLRRLAARPGVESISVDAEIGPAHHLTWRSRQNGVTHTEVSPVTSAALRRTLGHGDRWYGTSDDAFTEAPWAVYAHTAGNIVCSMADHDIVWGENIVWGEGLIRAAIVDNIVWSMFDDDMARAMTDVIAAAR